MTKAAIIGTNLFAPLILYWYNHFKAIWYNEVDRVYIAVSDPVHKSISEALTNYLARDPKIKIVYTNRDWPNSVTYACDLATEDLFFIPHDDTFILTPGALTRNFSIAAQGLVVTPIHNHYHPPYLIDELMMAKWPTQLPWIDPVTKSPGFSFFCNYFFISRENYLKTSRNMRDWRVNLGEPCEILGHTPKVHPMFSDVQFLFGLELLQAGVKFEIVEKCELPNLFLEGNPLDALQRHFDTKTGFYTKEWVHLQSIGFNVSGTFFDLGEREAIQAGRKEKVYPKYHNYPFPTDNMSIYTYIMRAAFLTEWLSIKEPPMLKDYYDHLRSELPGYIKHFGLNREYVKQFQFLFKKLIFKDAYAKTIPA